MTEREAWEVLAKDAGRERARLAAGYALHTGGNITHNGLCGGLDYLPASEAIRRRMRQRIMRELRTRRVMHGEQPAWAWPLTPSGFKRRAAWARKQAARRAR